MADRAPWIKLWADYTSTPSHDELDAQALWVGVVLMLLVRAANGSTPTETVWALQQTGRPYTIAGIAQRARLTERETEMALEALVAAGTVAQRDDGAWGLPQFWRFQRTSSSERMARKRRRDGGRDATGDGGVTQDGVTSGVTVTHQTVTQEVQIATLPRSLRFPDSPPTPASGGVSSESRAEVEFLSRPEARSEAPAPRARKSRKSPPDGLAEHLLLELRAACKTLGRHGPRVELPTDGMRDSLAKLYAAEAPTAEDLSHVVHVRAELDRAGDAYGSLDWEHLCRPANYRRYRDREARGTTTRPRPYTPSDFGENEDPDE